MRRYMLFAGENYHSQGGVLDLIGTFDSLSDAAAKLECTGDFAKESHSFEWGHIFDAKGFGMVVRWSDHSGFCHNTLSEQKRSEL